MTPESQRIAIAVACGINTTDCREQLERFKDRPDYSDAIFQLAKIPDYLSDLNAMHEALCFKRLCWTAYVCDDGYCVQIPNGHGMVVVIGSDLCETFAEAFLRTLNLWENDDATPQTYQDRGK